MKSFKYITAILLLIMHFITGSVSVAGGVGLAGHYLIGPQIGTDFPDLQSAIDQIELNGISDHVELLFTPGVHSTHVQINPITRTGNPDARLTLTSQDENNRATLTHTPISAADNWIIRINQSTMIDLLSLDFTVEGNQDYTTAIMFFQGGSDINIIDNVFTAHPVAVLSEQDETAIISQLTVTMIDGLNIIDNEFYFGGGAVYLESDELDGLQDIKIEGNLMDEQTARGSADLIYLKFSRDVSIQRNQVSVSSEHANGIVLVYTKGLLFSRNKMFFSGGGQSFALKVLSQNIDSITQTVISNNFIQATQFGILLIGLNENVSVLNNTVLLSGTLLGTSVYSSAIRSNNSRVDEVNIRGNILINLADATDTRVISVTNSSMISDSNHNIMFDVDNSSFVLDGITYDTFSEYQNNTTLDNESKFRNVDFTAPSLGDLHLTAPTLEDTELLIPANPEIIRDIDGSFRATNLHRAGADDAQLPDLIYASGFDDSV